MQQIANNLNDKNKKIIELIGIGVGPFNLGLAALLEPENALQSVFFDTKTEFGWHEGLLLDDCYLQVPFLADLVTMSDPTSRYSFLNYLHAQGRLYQFYFYENFNIPRTEYNRYCHWVAQQLKNLRFGQEVIDIAEVEGLYRVSTRDVNTGLITQHLARHVALGVGTRPSTPAALKSHLNARDFVHTANYKFTKAELHKKASITVIGSGQSAAECFLDLLRDQPQFDYELNWLTRSAGYFPMEYSKLGLEHFSPDYTEHFYGLPEAKRQSILATQGHLYKGISFRTIREIYDCLYTRSIEARPKVVIQARSELMAAHPREAGWKLDFRHTELDQEFSFTTGAVVLGSGYTSTLPSCLDGLKDLIDLDTSQRPLVDRHYTLRTRAKVNGKIFVQNGEMHTHGISAPDLGLGSYRNSVIINQLLGYERYPTTTKTVFQTFGVAPQWQSNADS